MGSKLGMEESKDHQREEVGLLLKEEVAVTESVSLMMMMMMMMGHLSMNDCLFFSSRVVPLAFFSFLFFLENEIYLKLI